MSFNNQSYQSPARRVYEQGGAAAAGGAVAYQQFQNAPAGGNGSQQQLYAADTVQSQHLTTNQGQVQGNISPNKNAISRLQYNNQFYAGGQENNALAVNPRIVYLRKLYFALFVQLSVIASFAWIVYAIPDVHAHLSENLVYFWVGLGGTILIGALGIFSRATVQKSPLNVVLMVLWTLCFGMVLIYASSIAKDAVSGLMVLELLAALVLGQFVYALTVRYELTYQGSTVFVFGVAVLVFHAFTLFTDLTFFTMLVITSLVLLFVFYLIFDTQSYVSGPTYDLNKEEWKSGTVLAYLDVFMLLLRLGDLSKTMITKNQN